MITLESVLEQINKTRGRFTSAKDRIPEVQEKVLNIVNEWTSAVIDGATDEELQKIRERLTDAEKELELLENLDTEKEIKKALSCDKKLTEISNKFIEEQEAILEEMMVQDEPLNQEVLDAYSALIDAVKKRREHRNSMIAVTGRIEDVKHNLGLPLPLSGLYTTYELRMKAIPHDKMFNRIRIANGQMPNY